MAYFNILNRGKDMSIQEILDRLEQIKDGLSDVDNRWGIEGTIDDIGNLMLDIEENK